MTDIQDKLKQLLAEKSLMRGAEWKQQAQEHQQRIKAGEYDIDHIIPGTLYGDDACGFHLVQTDFPVDTMQGTIALHDVFHVTPEHIGLAACDMELETFDAHRALFIDTETTGLAGGTGTVAFLIGAGYFEEDGFRLDQCFMRDYPDEVMVLEYLENLLSKRDTLVTFNGKSFDIPLLRTRCIQNRIRSRIDSCVHLDLVHAARRFWKRRLGDCSLCNVEQNVLGILRHDDVSSAEIPELWLEYVRTRDARKMGRVFYHHQMDVLSLVALTAMMSHTIHDAETARLEHEDDRLSIIRLHFRHRQYDEVTKQGSLLLESDTNPSTRWECLALMGLAHKRRGEWSKMEQAWSILIEECPTHWIARHELAKHHEHRTRNLFIAERLCSEAVELIEENAALHGIEAEDEGPIREFRRRLARIRTKLSRTKRLDET